jgi:predicted hydrocarbon binding protein
MSVPHGAPVQLPPAALQALRDTALTAPGGEQRLRDAGFAAGSALYEALDARTRAETGAGIAQIPLDAFVPRTSVFLMESGWGAIALAGGADVGVVAVEAAPWTEAELAAPAVAPACHLSTGLLAGFFGRLASAPLAVLETECRAAGAARCRFLIGSPTAMRRQWELARGR